MCCNWKVLAGLGALGVIIFAIAPGWDTGAFALGFILLSGATKWLGDRGILSAQCALPRADPSRGEDRVQQLQAQRRTLEQQETAIKQELAHAESLGGRR